MFLSTSRVLELAFLVISCGQLARARQCTDLSLFVPLNSTNTVFNLAPPANDVEVTNFVLNLTQVGGSSGQQYANGTANKSSIYFVEATFCAPTSTTKKSAIQILSHGIGFKRSYWDYPGYSYVDAALARGYSTLFYDRLGAGGSRISSHTNADLDPINELQSSLEVALLSHLSTVARTGQLGSNITAFDRVLHVGHSLGAISIYGAVGARSNLSDGVALTGFTPNGSYVPFFQFASNFVSAAGRVEGYPKGYLTFGTASALHTNQFAPGGAFDAGLLEPLFKELQPTGVGTLLTLGGPLAGLNGFKGPVIAVTGSRDLPFCGGNCETTDPPLPAQVGSLFPNASKFDAVVVPGAGHALNLHLSRNTTYTAILDFFDSLAT